MARKMPAAFAKNVKKKRATTADKERKPRRPKATTKGRKAGY